MPRAEGDRAGGTHDCGDEFAVESDEAFGSSNTSAVDASMLADVGPVLATPASTMIAVRRTRAVSFALVSVISVALSYAYVVEARGAKKPPKAKTSPPTAQLVWPLPPDQPRVRYLKTYRGIDDFKPSKRPSKLMAVLLGGEDPDAQPSDMMVKPYGVAVSSRGQLYVADTAARRVFRFDADSKTLSFVGESGEGRLSKPIGVAVDGQGTVFVADGTLKRVFGYAQDGRVTVNIGRFGELANPSGLAIDRSRDRLYVADAALHRIASYSTLDGALISTFGKRGSEPGAFNFPTNLAVDAGGRLYVADTLNFRIQVFDVDGTFLKEFGTLGDMPGTLNRPKGLGIDSDGHIYVVDSSFDNFQIFDSDGQLLLSVGAGGNKPGEFSLPAGLFIDEQDRIYVADQGNSRVQVFQYIQGADR